jgi:hypothetical protein
LKKHDVIIVITRNDIDGYIEMRFAWRFPIRTEPGAAEAVLVVT